MSARGLSFSAVFSVFYFAIILGAVAVSPVFAALPIADWTYSVSDSVNSNAFVAILDSARVAAVAYQPSYDTIIIAGRSLDGSQEQLWTNANVCQNAIAGLAAYPHAQDPDALIVVACETHLVALNPTNGSVVWDISIGQGGALSLQGPSNVAPLPLFIAPAAGTRTSRFVVPLYPSNNGNGGSTLTLLGVVDPVSGTVGSADVPCFGTVQAIHDGGAADVIVVSCAPGDQGTGTSTLKAFSTANGRLDALWQWTVPQHAGLSVAGVAGPGAASTDFLAMVYVAPYNSNNGNGYGSSFTWYFRVDAVTGTRWNITDMRGSAPYAPASNDQVLTAVSAGAGSFAFWAAGSLSFATLGGSGNASYLDFTAATVHTQQYPSTYQVLALAGVPFATARHFAAVTQNTNTENVYSAAYDSRGNQRVHALAATDIYNAQATGLRVSYCPDTLRVLLAGASQVSGYEASATGQYTSIFTSDKTATSVTVSGIVAAIATTTGDAFAFASTAGSSWQHRPEGNSGPTLATTFEGVTYVAGVYRVYAYGPSGTQLWVSKSLFGSEWAQEIALVGQTVVLRMPSRVIAVDVNDGSLAYEYNWQPSTAAGARCTAPSGSSFSFLQGSPVGTSAYSALVAALNSQNTVHCSYLVRSDSKVIPVAIPSIGSTTVAPNGNFILTSGSNIVEIERWTGETRWTANAAGMLGNGYTMTVMSGETVMYLFGYNANQGVNVLQCYSRSNGALLWSINGNQNTVESIFAVATDDIIVTLYDSSGTNDLTMLRNTRTGNTASYEIAWQITSYQPVQQGVLLTQGVVVVLSEYGPTGYNCEEQCMNGFDVTTGTELWGVLNTYGENENCNGPITPLMTSPPRGVMLNCDLTLYALDAFSGNQYFVVTAAAGQPLGINGDVLVLEQNPGNDGGLVSALGIPPGPLIAFATNASKSQPMPARFDPPFVPPTLPPPPTPVPVPPMPSIVTPSASAIVDWTFTTQNENGCISSIVPVDGVYLVSGQYYLYFVSELNGTALRTIAAPNDCNQNFPSSIVASSTLFVVACSSSYIAFAPNGTQLYQVYPSGGVTTYAPVPLPQSSIAIYTGNDNLVFVAADGSKQTVNVPVNNGNAYTLPPAAKMPSRNGIIVYQGVSVVAVWPNGTVAWNANLDGPNGDDYSYQMVVDVILMADMSASVAAEDEDGNVILLRVTPTGSIDYRFTALTQDQINYNQPDGVLSSGVVKNKTVVVYTSPQAVMFIAIDYKLGNSLWRYTANSNLQTIVGAAVIDACVLVVGQTSTTFAACIDGTTGATLFQAHFGIGVQYGGSVTAFSDPLTGAVTFVANKLIGQIKPDSTVAWSYTQSNLQYYQHLRATSVIDPGTPTSRILVYAVGDSQASNNLVMLSTKATEDRDFFFPTGSNLASGVRPFAVVPQSGSADNVSLAIVDGNLLFLGCAQTGTTLWRAGLTGNTPTLSGFSASTIFFVQGRVAVLRTTGVFFFSPENGALETIVSATDLYTQCTPTNTNYLSGWSVNGYLVLSSAQCLYVFDGTTARAVTLVGGLGGQPLWSGGHIVATNEGGAIVGISPATGTIVWSAPPPLNTNTNNNGNGASTGSASGGTSTVYSVGSGGCISAHFAPTGAELWQTCIPQLQYAYYSTVTTPCVATESLLLVNGANGLIAIDISLAANNSRRFLWQIDISQNNHGQTYTFPPQYSMGVAVTYSQGTLAAANATNGVQLWTYQTTSSCQNYAVSGSFVIAACDTLRVFDLVSGKSVPQMPVGQTIYDVEPLPPSAGNLRVGFSSQTNSGFNFVAAARLAEAKSTPPAPPLPGNATVPPGFVPELPSQTQVPPTFKYESIAPYGATQWSWPAVNQQFSTTALLLSPQYMVFQVGATVMVASTATQTSLWNATLSDDCQDNFQFAREFGDTIAFVCGQGTPSYYNAMTGTVTRGSTLLPGVVNGGGSQQYYGSAPPTTLPNAGKTVVGFNSNVWNSNQGEYVYTYGVVLFGPSGVNNYSCANPNTNSPPQTTTFTSGGKDTLVIRCWNGNVTWVDGATGAIMSTLPAANQTTASAITTDGRYVALFGSSNLSATQIAIVDTTTRAVKAVFGTNPPLPTQTIQLVRGATDDELLLINTNNYNVSVTAYTLDLRNSGSVVSETWWSTPFGSENPYSITPVNSFITANVIIVTSDAGTAFLQTLTGDLINVEPYPTTGGYTPAILEAAGLVTFQYNSATVVYRLSDGKIIARGPSSGLNPAPSAECLVVATNAAFKCFDTNTSGWLHRATPLPSPGTVAFGTNGDTLLVTSLSDVTAINVTSGAVVYSRGFPGSARNGGVIRVGDFTAAFASSGTVWLFDLATGTLEFSLEMSLCKQAPTSTSQYNVKVGKRLFIAGQAGCVFMLDATNTANPTVKTVIDAPLSQPTASGSTPLFSGPTAVYWLDAPYGQLTAIDATTGASKWAAPVPTGSVYRAVVEYGVFVYAVAGTHTVNVHRAVDGVQVASVPVSNATLFGTMRAFNGRLWLPTLTGVVSISADPVAAMAGDVRYVTAFTVQTAPASTQNFGNIKISPDGVAVVVGSSNSAGIDTVTGAVLWSAAATTMDRATNHQPDFTIDGAVVVGGVSGSGFSVVNLRSGAVTKRWNFPRYSSTLKIDDPVLVVNGIAMFANYYNLVAGLPIGPAPSVAPVPTATAPANSDVPTAPPPTPVPTGVAGASLGCVRRIDTETALLRACVSSTVVAPLYEGRAAGVSTLDCARGAPALASCVANYAATMAGCGAGIAYLREVLASINATGAPLAACGRAGVCTTAAGEAAFCAALDVPSWAAAAGPLPATGLPPIPTFTSAAATTPAPPPTTAAPPTTQAPPTTPAPSTATPTPLPPLSAVLALRLLAGAVVPTQAQLAAELQQALTLGAPADIQLFGVQTATGAALDAATGATVLFAFRGVNAASLALRTRALPAATLASVLHASSVGPVAPPPTPPVTTATPSAAPQTTTSGAPQPPGPTTTTAPTASGAPTPTPSPTASGAPTPTPTPPVPTTTGAPQPPSTATPQPVSELLALVLQPGAAVPTAAVLATELQAALGLSAAPAVTVVGLERGDTVIFAFVGAGSGRLAQAYLALPAATLQRDLHASKAAPATGAVTPSGGSDGDSKGTPTWVVPVVVVMGVLLAGVLMLVVAKRDLLDAVLRRRAAAEWFRARVGSHQHRW